MNPISLEDAIKNVYQVISQFRGTVGGQTLNAIEMIAVMQSHKIMVDELAKRQLAIDNIIAEQTGSKKE